MQRCLVCLEGYEPTDGDNGVCPKCRAIFEQTWKQQEMDAEYDECARQIIREVFNG